MAGFGKVCGRRIVRAQALLCAMLLAMTAGSAAVAEPAACHRLIVEGQGILSLRQAQEFVADFETLASQAIATQPDPSPETIESLNMFARDARAHLVSIAVGKIAIGNDSNDACLVCSPTAIAPNPPNGNGGFPWSALGIALRHKAATERLVDHYSTVGSMELLDEWAANAVSILKDRKKHPYCEDASPAGEAATVEPKCYKGAYVHTAGPRTGKIVPATLCIDWRSQPCAFTGKSITGQSIASCVPDGGIVGEVSYKGGKSVAYDLAFDGDARLVGLWWQSDGASGEWRPE